MVILDYLGDFDDLKEWENIAGMAARAVFEKNLFELLIKLTVFGHLYYTYL